jgi:hypothetical protein
MQNLKLRINDKIYNHLMWFLGRFSQEEIQIIKEDNVYISVQDYLVEELNKVEDGDTGYLSIDQLDESLEATIRKHET